MALNESSRKAVGEASLLASRLAYHLRCLREDATDPAIPAVERLALVRERARKIQEVRWKLSRNI